MEFTTTVLYYVKLGVNTVTMDKLIWVNPNQKPWLTAEIKMAESP